MYAGLLLLPLYLLGHIGVDVATVGLMLLAMELGSAVALYLGSYATDRYGAGRIVVAGSVLLVSTTIPFLASSQPSTIALTLVLAVRGVGIALAQMPAMTAVYASVRVEAVGDASTVVNIAQRIGGAVGAIAVVAVFQQTGGASGPESYAWAFVTLFFFSVACLISACTLKRSESHKRPSA